MKSPGPRRIRTWIERARDGEARAMNELCDHFGPPLRRYISLRLGGRLRGLTESGDIAQQVLFETMSSLDDLPPGTVVDERRFLRHMFDRAIWRVRDTLRRRQHDRERLREDTPADGAGTTGPVTRADSTAWITELVRRLPEPFAEVVQLCALQELSYEEAARELNVSADTVRKRYERARSHLERAARRDSRDG